MGSQDTKYVLTRLVLNSTAHSFGFVNWTPGHFCSILGWSDIDEVCFGRLFVLTRKMQSCRLVLLTAAAAPFGEQELMKRRPDGHRRQSGKKEVKASHSRTNGTKVKATHSRTVAQMKKR